MITVKMLTLIQQHVNKIAYNMIPLSGELSSTGHALLDLKVEPSNPLIAALQKATEDYINLAEHIGEMNKAIAKIEQEILTAEHN